MSTKTQLTVETLRQVAAELADAESVHAEPTLYGVTDGKKVGTYLEHKLRATLHERYVYDEGSSAKGIDFPGLGVDLKVTKYSQPQSSCPFRSARQKVYGLGYGLLVFVYDKTDDEATKTATLRIQHVIFVEKEVTADFQTTRGILQILANDGNDDDLVAFMRDRNLPLDDIQALQLAEEILSSPPRLGYLTISNALQWRLQYKRVIDKAGEVAGLVRVR